MEFGILVNYIVDVLLFIFLLLCVEVNELLYTLRVCETSVGNTLGWLGGHLLIIPLHTTRGRYS